MTIVIEGTLQPDGTTLLLDRKLGLPPGKVMVTIQDDPSAASPSDEETAAEIEAMGTDDDGAEARLQELETRTQQPPN